MKLKYLPIYVALITVLCQVEAEAEDKSPEHIPRNYTALSAGIDELLSLPGSVDPDSISFYEKYPDKFSALIEYFNNKGFDLPKYLKNPNFKVYEGIGDRFRGSVERKSRSLEEYKEILKFEDKKNRMPGFIASHYDHLKLAEEQYGISKYIISAIIAVESDYGTKTGSYNPFNSYVSMYIEDYRADFARAQLEELLIFTEKNNLDVFDLKSSYAGAVSAAQFIPYSLNRWFIGDDIFDMSNNILSVANYLSYFKEITGSIEKAVHRYNPSTLYTRAVTDLAAEVEEFMQTFSLPSLSIPDGNSSYN